MSCTSISTNTMIRSVWDGFKLLVLFVPEQNLCISHIALCADHHVSGGRRCGSKDAVGVSASAGRRPGGE